MKDRARSTLAAASFRESLHLRASRAETEDGNAVAHHERLGEVDVRCGTLLQLLQCLRLLQTVRLSPSLHFECSFRPPSSPFASYSRSWFTTPTSTHGT